MRAYRVVEHLFNHVDRIFFAHVLVGLEFSLKVSGGFNYSVLVPQIVTGQQAVNVLKEGLGRHCVLEGQVGVERAFVKALYKLGVLKNTFDFAGIYKILADLCVVQGLDSEKVASDENRVICCIVNSKSKHAAQARKQILLPLLKAVNKHLAVGFGGEFMSLFNQFLTDSLVVVDLAVEGEHQGFILVVNRLMTCFKVDYRQAPKAHSYGVVGEKAVGIRSAVSNDLCHFADSFVAVFKLACKAANTTHI